MSDADAQRLSGLAQTIRNVQAAVNVVRESHRQLADAAATGDSILIRDAEYSLAFSRDTYMAAHDQLRFIAQQADRRASARHAAAVRSQAVAATAQAEAANRQSGRLNVATWVLVGIGLITAAVAVWDHTDPPPQGRHPPSR